jgi:hypothetical protein
VTGQALLRIPFITLRYGTRYRIVEGDRLSEARVLERDTEAQVRRLAFAPREVAAYVLDHDVLLVAHEGEMPDARAT